VEGLSHVEGGREVRVQIPVACASVEMVALSAAEERE